MAEFTLFNQQSASSTFKLFLDEIAKEVNSKSNEYILNVNIEQWKQYFLAKYDYLPLTVFPEKATVDFIHKGTIKQEQFGKTYEVETYTFEVSIPFTGWYFLFMLAPSHRTVSHPRVSVPSADSGLIRSRFTLYGHDEKRFDYEKNEIINAIIANVPNINRDLESFKLQVLGKFEGVFQQKKQKVLSENKFFEALNIKVEKSTDKLFKVPIIERKKIPEPIIDRKTIKKYTETPSLPDELYDDILEVVCTFYKSVEKKPSTYESKDEESLRDYILPTLETRYNNVTATGETFNKGGKTDILVKYKDGTNLFVAECKFWKGEAAFIEAINQLFERYLTWRDSKVAVILFVTNKEFSKVLETIKAVTKKHPYFLRENGVRGESSFSYIFHFPTDKAKYIYTEIMAFHLP